MKKLLLFTAAVFTHAQAFATEHISALPLKIGDELTEQAPFSAVVFRENFIISRAYTPHAGLRF